MHETATVLRLRQGVPAVERLWQILQLSGIEIVSFDEAQVLAAAQAFDISIRKRASIWRIAQPTRSPRP